MALTVGQIGGYETADLRIIERRAVSLGFTPAQRGSEQNVSTGFTLRERAGGCSSAMASHSNTSKGKQLATSQKCSAFVSPDLQTRPMINSMNQSMEMVSDFSNDAEHVDNLVKACDAEAAEPLIHADQVLDLSRKGSARGEQPPYAVCGHEVSHTSELLSNLEGSEDEHEDDIGVGHQKFRKLLSDDGNSEGSPDYIIEDKQHIFDEGNARQSLFHKTSGAFHSSSDFGATNKQDGSLPVAIMSTRSSNKMYSSQPSFYTY